jgi:glutaredoxin 3
MNKNTIIYTSSLCGYCYRAKSLLKRKNILFEEIDIDLDYSKRNEMIEKSGGETSVPQIFYKNRHIGGCDDLYKLEEENGLEIFIKSYES